MDWTPYFSVRTRHLGRSTVRELLKLTTQPEMISFAGGLPAPELFPAVAVAAAAERVLTRHGPAALQYGETEGVGELRDWIAAHLSTRDHRFTRENVLIVSGSQQGLDLLGRVLLDPEDTLFVENPTYLAMLSAFRVWGVRFVALPSDAEGMGVEALSGDLPARSKLVYCVPNYQNPQGTTLSRPRRKRLVELALEKRLLLLEDNPYGMLCCSGEPLPSLLQLAAETGAADHTVYLGTFSKVLAPGLRVGWVLAAPELIDKLVQAKQAADLHTSTFNQYLILEMLQQGVLERQLPILRRAYRERRDAMLAALSAHFPPGATWTTPGGGMFIMARLADSIDTTRLLPLALARNVAFVPGADFHLGGGGTSTMRLNFSNAPPERIAVGIERLGGLVREQLRAA